MCKIGFFYIKHALRRKGKVFGSVYDEVMGGSCLSIELFCIHSFTVRVMENTGILVI